MSAIGPQIPSHLLNRRKGDDDSDDDEPHGPQIPAQPPPHPKPEEPVPSTSKRTIGPSFPGDDDDDDDDDNSSEDDIGPMPLPAHSFHRELDGVQEFTEREERRRKLAEDAAKPKTLKRDEWMLVPPSSSGILGSLDPAKLKKARQFSRSTASAKKVDNSLWTETPAERQQRLADEVSGKKRRAVNADDDDDNELATAEDALQVRKKHRMDAEIKKSVEEHTRKMRGSTLVDMHTKSLSSTKDEDSGQEKYFGIWDHSRDMSIGGRLLDDTTRNKLVKDARGLGDRFKHGKHGGFL